MMRFLCIVSPILNFLHSHDDCFAALQLILSRFIGWRRFHRNHPTVFGHAGRVTLPMRRPWRFPAYDRFTVLSDFPFIASFTI